MRLSDPFDSLCVLDSRYWKETMARYLSENTFTRRKLDVIFALVTVLHRRGICPDDAFQEIKEAYVKVTTTEVYHEEDRIHHDIRALANCIRDKVSDKAKPFVYLIATSYDIIDTARAILYKDAITKLLVPALIVLEDVLISHASLQADEPQVGRTHGQHASPVTFGFAMACYVSRLGGCIEALEASAKSLRGKFSGAVGAGNAASLFFAHPELFEVEVLLELGLAPAECSTQIAPPEALARLLSEVVITAGVMANLARDMRNLQRTEIGEVGEESKEEDVGSSTMPHKVNPKDFENVESLWKIVMGRMVTVFMDQVSDHQRDLTNSASARTYGEIIVYATSMADRLGKTMKKLIVNHANLQRNLGMEKGLIMAEPLQLILAVLGHPNSHEKAKQLSRKTRQEVRTFQEVYREDKEVQEYLARATAHQLEVLNDPRLYIGIAAKKARFVAKDWKQKLGL